MGSAEEVVVLDTNVLVSALGWRGPEHRLYERCATGHRQMATSGVLLDELRRVLNYPKFGFTASEIDGFESNIRDHATVVEPTREIEKVTRDPDDNRVLECAIAAEANWIVSGDPHLLDLEKFRQIPIVPARSSLELFGIE